VQWIRWRHKIPYPASDTHDGELTVAQLAQRFGISDGTVYAWIETGKLDTRRGPANRIYIPFPPKVEQHRRRLVTSSVHLPAETKIRAAGGAV
jgi:transposase-like protein